MCFYPDVYDCFYNPAFIEMAKDYWGAMYAKPQMMLFNVCGPHHSGLSSHLDGVTFRGIRYENSPVWLMNTMAKSGLFADYLVKKAQVITWWYRGDNGTFTYWPDGPNAGAARSWSTHSGTRGSSSRTSGCSIAAIRSGSPRSATSAG